MLARRFANADCAAPNEVSIEGTSIDPTLFNDLASGDFITDLRERQGNRTGGPFILHRSRRDQDGASGQATLCSFMHFNDVIELEARAYIYPNLASGNRVEKISGICTKSCGIGVV